MTKYHSDDYIKFLRSIRPDNMSEYSKQMQRCEYFPFTGSNWLPRRTAPLFPPSCFAVNVGEDCPVFDGLFEFCQLSVGGSVGEWEPCLSLISAIFSADGLTIVVAFSWGCEVEQTADRHCHQLGWRPSPRQEIWGLRVLLRQRHSSGYSGITEVGWFHWWVLEFPRVEPNFKIMFSECLNKPTTFSLPDITSESSTLTLTSTTAMAWRRHFTPQTVWWPFHSTSTESISLAQVTWG